MGSDTIKKKKRTKNKDQKSKQGRKKDRRMTAKTADKYELYQRAVNSPESDVDFLLKAYAEVRGGEPTHLREDFCGTAALSAEWLGRGADKTAEGFDNDPEPIAWGLRHNFKALGEAAERMNFHESDVRDSSDVRPDVRVAANFSYWIFHERPELLAYLQSCHADLAEDGLFVMDLYGGPEAMIEMEETRALGGGIEYVWDQKEYWPGSGEYSCAIHFRFKDGSEMTNAFEYGWRFWHLTELKDLLIEAGFANVDAYFEGTDEDDEESGDGIFEKDARGENCEAWIGYLVAAK